MIFSFSSCLTWLILKLAKNTAEDYLPKLRRKISAKKLMKKNSSYLCQLVGDICP